MSSPIETKTANPEEQAYLDLLRLVIETGEETPGARNGSATRKLFAKQLSFSCRAGRFPLMTTRPVHFRLMVEELMWMLSGSTDTEELNRRRVKFWNANASRETLDKLGFKDREVGDLGPTYGHSWRNFGGDYVYKKKVEEKDKKEEAETTPAPKKRGVDQIANIIAEIIKNPENRRLIVSAWNPPAIPFCALPPCHILFQFMHSPNTGELHLSVLMRSWDLVLGAPYNVGMYALLLCLVAGMTGKKPGTLYFTANDAHVYANHIPNARKLLERTPREFPTLEILKMPKTVEELTIMRPEDFKVHGYEVRKEDELEFEMAV